MQMAQPGSKKLAEASQTVGEITCSPAYADLDGVDTVMIAIATSYVLVSRVMIRFSNTRPMWK